MSVEIDCSYDEMLPISKAKPHPKNNNRHPKEQIERLAKIIEYQGFRSAIVISKLSGFIVKGHGRLLAAKKLGMKKVPVNYQSYEDESQEYADLTADNEVARWAELDIESLLENADLLHGLPDLDLLGIEDFELPDIDIIIQEKKEHKDMVTQNEESGIEDDVPDAPEIPKTKRGDIWLLGKHRVMCGDSTHTIDIEKLMKGNMADMIFTDPPYGMSLNADYSNMPCSPTGAIPKKWENIKGDHDDFTDDLIKSIFNNFSYCEDIFICGADYFCEVFPDKNSGSWIVWDKRVTENFDRMIGSAFELIWSKKKRKREIARINNTLYSGESDAINKVHPTQKPLKLMDWIFDRAKGKKVADLYLGSGTTLISCEKNKRVCYGMELDEKYCDVIIKRWQQYTGKQAILERTGEKYNEIK